MAALWVGLLLATPGWRGSGHDGRVIAAAAVDLAASRICHRRPDRSFHWHGEPLPVCGRCMGLYVSGALGLVAAAVAGDRASRRASVSGPRWQPARHVVWMVAAALPTLLSWALEVGGVWNPGTPIRAVAALPLGATVGWVVGEALARRRQH